MNQNGTETGMKRGENLPIPVKMLLAWSISMVSDVSLLVGSGNLPFCMPKISVHAALRASSV
jgi:hypothetical protein